MIWLVIDSLYIKHSGNYFIIIQTSEIKLLAEVFSFTPVLKGDILYPIDNAPYLINEQPNKLLRSISAVKYSHILWLILKRMHKSREKVF